MNLQYVPLLGYSANGEDITAMKGRDRQYLKLKASKSPTKKILIINNSLLEEHNLVGELSTEITEIEGRLGSSSPGRRTSNSRSRSNSFYKQVDRVGINYYRVCIGRRRIKSTTRKYIFFYYAYYHTLRVSYHIISYDYCTCVIRILRSYFFSFYS